MEPEVYRKPIIPEKAKFARMVLLLCNMVFFCFGACLLSIGLYVQLDHGFVSEIIGSALYMAAAYLSMVAGFVVMFLAFFGSWSAYQQRKPYLIVFLVITIVLMLGVMAGAVLALMFKATMIQTAKDTMEYTLRRQFGKTRLITEAWHLTQSKLRCCGIDTNGWSVYNNSEWDIMTNADARDMNLKIPEWSPLYKFVPESCCLRLIDPRTLWPMESTRNLQQCQYWPYGPPNRMQGGFNDALYYRGCFEAGAEFLSSHSRFFAGIGFFLFIVMIVSAICSVILVANVTSQMLEARSLAERARMKDTQPLMKGYEY